MKRARVLAAVGCLALLAACSLYRNDRQFVWDSEYQKVCDLYNQCGSIAVVEQVLRDHQWTRGQINEVRYRLAQDYWLDDRGVPRGIDRPRPVVPAAPTMKLGVGPGARD